MIKINLLPVEERREIRGIGELIFGIAILGAVFLAIFAVNMWQVNQIKSKEKELKQITADVKKLEPIKKERDRFIKQNKALEKKISVIKVLEENRTGPLFVMDSLGIIIPKGVWIDTFKEKGLKASMVGVAQNEKTVAEFLRRLEESVYFESVRLKEIKSKKFGSDILKTFKIDTALNYSGKKKEEKKPQKSKKGLKKKS